MMLVITKLVGILNNNYEGYFKDFASLSHSLHAVNTVMSKLRAHVTEGIQSAHENFHSNLLKVTW